MKNILNGKTFLIIAVLAIAAAIVYANYATKQANEGVEVLTHIKGNPDAKLILREYSDFQCPACGQFYPIAKGLVEQYDGQLALEYKHFPLISIHQYAVPSAKAAEAAGQQGQFFAMHDKLFDNQQVWSRSGNPRVYFDQYAEELGLDMEQFRRQYGSSIIEDKIESEYNEARELGLTGTPSFYLNDKKLQFETFDEFISAIETELGVSSTESATSTTDNSESAGESGGEVRFGF